LAADIFGRRKARADSAAAGKLRQLVRGSAGIIDGYFYEDLRNVA
jgi:hypothetical protein